MPKWRCWVIYPTSCWLKQIIYMQRSQLFALNCVLSAPDWDVRCAYSRYTYVCMYAFGTMAMLLVSSLVIAAEAMSVDWYRIQACWKLFALIIRWLMFATESSASASAPSPSPSPFPSWHPFPHSPQPGYSHILSPRFWSDCVLCDAMLWCNIDGLSTRSVARSWFRRGGTGNCLLHLQRFLR